MIWLFNDVFLGGLFILLVMMVVFGIWNLIERINK